MKSNLLDSENLLAFAKIICLLLFTGLLFTNGYAQNNVAEKGSKDKTGSQQAEEETDNGEEDTGIKVEELKSEGSINNVAVAEPSVEPGAGDVQLLDGPEGMPPVNPVAPPEPGQFFTEEQKRLLGIPGFADKDSGFIPDTDPTDLFADSSQPRSFVFQTMLGDPKLPAGSADALISRYGRTPESQLGDNQARIVVPSGNITGSVESKQFQIEGGLTIYYSDVSITAQSADIDEKNDRAILYGDVNIVDPKYTLTTDELRLYFEDKRFIALGFVQLQKEQGGGADEPDLDLEKKDRLRDSFAGEQFELYCKNLLYDWETKEMIASESVRIVHPSFSGTMERIDYNDELKEYRMSGGVVLNVADYGWIFDNELVEADDFDKVRSITDNETTITCDQLNYSEESGVAEFYARIGKTVLFDQDARSIEASYMEVNDQTKDFFAEGREGKQVQYQQTDGDWMFTGGIVDREEASEDLVAVFDKPLTVNSDTFVYNFDRKRLELTGSISMSGTGKSLKAGQLIQDETAKFFLLRDNVFLKPDESSEIRAAQVYIDTENDIFTFVGLVEGKLESEDLIVAAEGEDGESGEIEVQQGLFQNQAGSNTGNNRSSTAGGNESQKLNTAER